MSTGLKIKAEPGSEERNRNLLRSRPELGLKAGSRSGLRMKEIDVESSTGIRTRIENRITNRILITCWSYMQNENVVLNKGGVWPFLLTIV
ncbi:hypothetical protein EVAR_9817_1 [Eumeta japonica]|uniref:Uncharacterized protein n=1 Tax=Eumeta variegata TaxID=151549 RepID=A0A4C1U5J8_EUMVA|nr:hypothetical protein EVAR_9817_1 [Eumeta japonica]